MTYLKVDDLKPLLDSGATVDVIDVRTRPEYDQLHIKGSRSVPLREMSGRAEEIAKTGLVVFY